MKEDSQFFSTGGAKHRVIVIVVNESHAVGYGQNTPATTTDFVSCPWHGHTGSLPQTISFPEAGAIATCLSDGSSPKTFSCSPFGSLGSVQVQVPQFVVFMVNHTFPPGC
jgi:hypothetical protein